MKKAITAALVLTLVVCVYPGTFAFAKEGKGASDKALQCASEQSIFNRVSDWFATVGKPEEKKQAILAQRQAERAAKRAEKEALKARKEAEKKAKEFKEKAKNWGE